MSSLLHARNTGMHSKMFLTSHESHDKMMHKVKGDHILNSCHKFSSIFVTISVVISKALLRNTYSSVNHPLFLSFAGNIRI